MSGKDLVFCKIASGEEEGKVAFHSIGGEAPVHMFVSRDHASSKRISEATRG